MLFHSRRDPFGEVVRLADGLAILRAGGGGLLPCFPGRLALYVAADGAAATLLQREL